MKSLIHTEMKLAKKFAYNTLSWQKSLIHTELGLNKRPGFSYEDTLGEKYEEKIQVHAETILTLKNLSHKQS